MQSIADAGKSEVHFMIVTDLFEIAAGVTGLDDVARLPIVEIGQFRTGLFSRILKRAFDVAVSSVLLLAFPLVRLWSAAKGAGEGGRFRNVILAMPRVFTGKVSLVGLPLGSAARSGPGRSPADSSRHRILQGR